MQQDELLAASAFSLQSKVFDDIYGNDAMIQYKRNRVRDFVSRHIPDNADILELNAGTGEDAIFFARQGHHVHATDVAPGMLETLRNKVEAQCETHITSELCSYTQLEDLRMRGPYDLIFSNFAGLNCCGDLEKVFREFNGLLKSGGSVVLVILPVFCLWETSLVFRGKWKTAFRRFNSSNSNNAKVEGEMLNCYYYSPAKIKRLMGDSFTRTGLEGLCSFVPPSYIEGFADKYSRTFKALSGLEKRFGMKWPFNRIGDYYMISFQKNEEPD